MERTSAGLLRPPRLRHGSRVALIAPAGPITDERFDIALDRCRRFGLEPVPGRASRNMHADYLAGTDAERLADLDWALNADDIDAVWALRGGYGTMRLLPDLHLDPSARPRAFIGFSDNTTLHLTLQTHGVVSFHGPHAGGDASALSEDCLRRVLFEDAAPGAIPMPQGVTAVTIAGGTAEGPLVGGNLALLAALCGTRLSPAADRAILFIEDIGETVYRIDRLWMQLLLAGVLDGVAGIALGSFTDCGAAHETRALFERLCTPLGVPVLAGLPFGHEDDNWTLPLGVRARLDADAGTLELLESAVS